MILSDIISQIKKIKTQRQGSARAPHKPLLLIYMLAKVQNKKDRLISYNEASKDLSDLLHLFGPPRPSVTPEQPFWRLRKDGAFWDIPDKNLVSADSKDNPNISDLKNKNIFAGFSTNVYNLLVADQNAVNEIVSYLLTEYFPDSIHEDILEAVGMPWVIMTKPRDPKFREIVLRSYQHRCAICGYDAKFDNSDLGLEAAHIQWHSYQGPSHITNGLALCSLHHKFLDRGAIGVEFIDKKYLILVSERVHGSKGIHDWLHKFVGEPLQLPYSENDYPDPRYIAWHQREVFQEPRLKKG